MRLCAFARPVTSVETAGQALGRTVIFPDGERIGKFGKYSDNKLMFLKLVFNTRSS